ncbi:MAG TPA: allantoinase AllB, partial [Longimicrobiaceae bacterium]|nr:allantoinase AllB [Longimicrobiaceae bacterium]
EDTHAASIHVRGGVIVGVGAYDDVPPAREVVDAGDDVVMPGLVDTHVHVNEPGRTEWEGWETATRAAAAGGVTTIVDMPLNSVPATTSVDGLRAKVAATEGRTSVDVGFWGGVVPGNAGELGALLDAGVLGFKCFLVHSGVDEFPGVDEADLRLAMPILAARNAVLLVHAELPGPIDAATAALGDADPRIYATYLRSRPPSAETEAVELVLRLARETGCRVHVVHLAAAEAVPALRAARAEGLPVTVETCPHYLRFDAEEVADGATELKCAPPIRGETNREHLWDALAEGVIDLIATDHSPCPPAMKLLDEGDFLRAWGGIASLQLSLPAVWTEARTRGHTFRQLAQWMCAAPARLAGLEHRKGSIALGRDADIVIWNPDAEFVVDPARLHHRHPVTPYAGAILAGAVRATYLRGMRIFGEGRVGAAAAGRLILGTDR